MRILLLTILLTGCAFPEGSVCSWKDFMCGPAEYLRDKYGMRVSSSHPSYYEKYWHPKVEVHVIEENLSQYCGAAARWGSKGCVRISPDRSSATIWMAKYASPTVYYHELKHAHGWCHYRPDYRNFWGMTFEQRQREIDRTSLWYPCE